MSAPTAQAGLPELPTRAAYGVKSSQGFDPNNGHMQLSGVSVGRPGSWCEAQTEELFTATQMRDYALAAVRAAQAAQPCIMCHGQGWHYMADAYLPGQGEAPKIKVKCNQCKVQAAQPTRKALSDAEIAECLAECDTTIQPRYLHKIFARAVEAAHGIHPAGKEAG